MQGTHIFFSLIQYQISFFKIHFSNCVCGGNSEYIRTVEINIPLVFFYHNTFVQWVHYKLTM